MGFFNFNTSYFGLFYDTNSDSILDTYLEQLGLVLATMNIKATAEHQPNLLAIVCSKYTCRIVNLASFTIANRYQQEHSILDQSN